MRKSSHFIRRMVLVSLVAVTPASAWAFSLSIPGMSMSSTKAVAPKEPTPATPPNVHPVAATDVSVPAALMPKAPVASSPSTVPAASLLKFRQEAQYASQSQALENHIRILKQEVQEAKLKAEMLKILHRTGKTPSPLEKIASKPGNYVQKVEGFNGRWHALMTLDGHRFWVQPGSNTPLGAVLSISDSGVVLRTIHGAVQIGLGDGQGNARPVVILPKKNAPRHARSVRAPAHDAVKSKPVVPSVATPHAPPSATTLIR